MANAHSPTRFNGEADNFFDPNYTLDISQKMRVPKSIRVSGDFTDQEISGTNGSAWNMMSKKLEMHVPDRILVAGQEQHIGTKAPPREIALENAVLPSVETPAVRCITPPRVLTLDTHYFPTADEDNRQNKSTDFEVMPVKPRGTLHNETQVVTRNTREQTPAYGVLDASLPPGEEVQQLRRQVGKLNRRVMAIESEIQQQQQKMKLVYIMAAMYICFKTMFWFGKN
ncbi:transport and Golgi organization protein 11 [Copidosoma floridanum]|uniref:transport and Golgi organization protein 11 n=1 Tax=Copidosoma floridanum TaxID=29053 RepID=UPI0006C93EA3|nr:transport and Golgi organization protein 11 [Copidosoma floridanum]